MKRILKNVFISCFKSVFSIFLILFISSLFIFYFQGGNKIYSYRHYAHRSHDPVTNAIAVWNSDKYACADWDIPTSDSLIKEYNFLYGKKMGGLFAYYKNQQNCFDRIVFRYIIKHHPLHFFSAWKTYSLWKEALLDYFHSVYEYYQYGPSNPQIKEVIYYRIQDLNGQFISIISLTPNSSLWSLNYFMPNLMNYQEATEQIKTITEDDPLNLYPTFVKKFNNLNILTSKLLKQIGVSKEMLPYCEQNMLEDYVLITRVLYQLKLYNLSTKPDNPLD